MFLSFLLKRWLEKILLETLVPFQRKESSSVLAGLHNLTSGKNLSLLFAKVYSNLFVSTIVLNPLLSLQCFHWSQRLFPHPSLLSDGHKAIHAWWSGSVAGRWSWSQLWRCCMDVGWACPPASWGSWLWCWASWAGYRQASAAESACSREAKRAVRGLRAVLRHTRGASGWPAGTFILFKEISACFQQKIHLVQKMHLKQIDKLCYIRPRSDRTCFLGLKTFFFCVTFKKEQCTAVFMLLGNQQISCPDSCQSNQRTIMRAL